MGETRAAQPLVEALRRHFPDAPLPPTQMTPAGRAAAQKLFPDTQCRYLPYDRPEWVRRFLRGHNPLFGVLMETETWPNLMRGCAEEDVPLFLTNARLSEKSQRGYLKACGLVEPVTQVLSGYFAQTVADAERLYLIGASSVHVCGNTKYDISPPDKMRALMANFTERIGRRPVAVCTNTRFYRGEDETEPLLLAWRRYRGDALLVAVLRHPERFQTACDAAQSPGFRAQKRSDDTMASSQTQVQIGDSMGELFAYYLTGSAVFVGDNLVDTDYQNITEPIACGVSIVFDFSTYNFSSAYENTSEAGAVVQVGGANE